MNLLKLASAKFPPEQTPALLKDMEAAHKLIEPAQGVSSLNINAELQVKFNAVLGALRDVKEHLTITQELDSVIVDADFDCAGYGILDIIEGKEHVATGRQIPLGPKMIQQLADVKTTRDLFNLDNAKGRDIFSLPYQEEFNAVEIVLARSKAPQARDAISRLGLANDFERLGECHAILQRLLGIGQASDGTRKPAFARFEDSIRQMIFAVGLYANNETDEHKHIRETLLGPYEKHVNAHRERQRKYAETKKSEPIPDPLLEPITN